MAALTFILYVFVCVHTCASISISKYNYLVKLLACDKTPLFPNNYHFKISLIYFSNIKSILLENVLMLTDDMLILISFLFLIFLF